MEHSGVIDALKMSYRLREQSDRMEHSGVTDALKTSYRLREQSDRMERISKSNR